MKSICGYATGFYGKIFITLLSLISLSKPLGAEITTVFLPGKPAFSTLAAGFDQPTFQARLRYDDETYDEYTPSFKKLNNAAKFLGHAELIAGDDFPFVNVDTGPYGLFQFGITGMIRALFALQYYSGPNLNTDFKVSFPVTYAMGTWSVRCAYYHISCHAGDELIVSNPQFKRVNTSREGIEFFVSKYIFDVLRIYGGNTVIVRFDETCRLKRFLFESGIEFKPYIPRYFNYAPRNFTPYTAFHIRTWQQYNWAPDINVMLGLELTGTIPTSARLLRIYGHYYHGHSPDGQFLNTATDYFGLGLSFGF